MGLTAIIKSAWIAFVFIIHGMARFRKATKVPSSGSGSMLSTNVGLC